MRVLVVRNDKIGDLVLALPAIAALKAAGHFVSVWASLYAAPLLENDSRVDEIVIDRPGKGYDVALLLWGNAKNAWAVWKAGIPRRLGISGRPFSLLFNERLNVRRSEGLKSEADYNLDFVRALGIDVELSAPELQLGEAAHTVARRWLESTGLKKPVMLHPGSRGSAQNWDAARYVELGRELRGRYGSELFVSCGPGEAELAESVAKELDCPWLTARLPLAAFAALTAEASLFVSASTGPMHLAAAMGTPTLSLFPPIQAMSPRRWGPLGNRHAVLSPEGLGLRAPAIEGLNYVERITVDEAAAAAGYLLKDAHA